MGEKTERGVCLFHKKMGEKDLECVVFSPISGTMYIKIVSSLKGGRLYLPLFSTSVLYLNTTSRLSSYILNDLTVETVRDNILNDYDRFSVISLLAKVLLYFGRYDKQQCYDLFIKSLDALERGLNPYYVFCHTVERFFMSEGIFGDYERCPFCEKPYGKEEVLGYSTEHFCSCCEKDANIVNVLSPSLREYLRATSLLDSDEIFQTDNIESDNIPKVNLYKAVAFECFRLRVLNKKYFNDVNSFLKEVKMTRGESK